MTRRRAVLTRTESAEPLVLQPRDEAIILACWEHQGLTSHQLQRLIGFGTATRGNARFRRLFDAQYLQRIRVATHAGGSLVVYVPGEAAVRIIASATGRPAPLVRRIVKAEAASSSLLRLHDLKVADVRMSIARAVAAHPRLHLETWRNARDCYHRFRDQAAVRPDGFFQVHKDDVVTSTFYELDQDTVDIPRFQTKAKRYAAYRDSGAFQNRYGVQRFRVAVTAPTPARLQRLIKATRAVVNRGWIFALTEQLVADGDVTRSIWLSLQDDTVRPLIDLEE